jgi:hypothetical protein
MAKISIGGPSQSVRVSLRILGDALEPDEITKLLGYAPTKAYRKGEPNERNQLPAWTGIWNLSIKSNDELETVVEALLEKLPTDLVIWRELAAHYRIDIFCGIWFEAARLNGGFGLSPTLMMALAERGLTIGFDIYFV